jgi:hypothetical protein
LDILNNDIGKMEIAPRKKMDNLSNDQKMEERRIAKLQTSKSIEGSIIN